MKNRPKSVKIILSVLACVVIFCLSAAVYILIETKDPLTSNAVSAETYESFNYTVLEDDTAAITGYTGSDKAVYIPDTINDHIVSCICSNSFSNTHAASVSLPKTIQTIEKNAFSGCKNLKSIFIPYAAVNIDEGAFGLKDEGTLYLDTITGISGSAAERFAEKNGFSFFAADFEIIEPASINLTESLTLFIDEKQTIEAAVYPYYATDTSVSWESSDDSIAAVENGEITGLSIGTAYITAKTANGMTDTCKVVVTTKKIPLYKFFKAVKQHPELPTGCEITALTSVLNFYGYNVSKLTMSDKYLEKGDALKTDYHTAFAGEPRSESSYGCYAPAIVNAANKYLIENKSMLRAEQLSGYSLDELLKFTDDGTPVIVWTTLNLWESTYTENWSVGKGKTVTWLANEHCMVLVGYTKDKVYAADPEYGKIKTYSKSLFNKRYKELFSQAVILK